MATIVSLATAAAGQAAGGHGGSSGSPATGRCQAISVSPPSGVTDSYNRQVLSLGPVAYLTLGDPSAQTARDRSGNGNGGVYLPAHDVPAVATLPNGDPATEFNGHGQYVQIPSSPVLSVTHSGCLSAEAWIRPKTLQFPDEQGSGYVYVLGKGITDKQEYAMRMYSRSNSEIPVRPNRISAYVFNLAGGEGSGSYFQDRVRAGQWMMVAFTIDDIPSASWPHGYVAIYKNGHLESQVSLGQFHVRPGSSSAPLRIATRDLDSYFEGAIGKVAIYDTVLTPSEVRATYKAMSR